MPPVARQKERLNDQSAHRVAAEEKCKTLVRDRRMAENPLAHLSGMNAEVEDGLERRILEPEEFAAFVQAATNGEPFRRLQGFDRVVVYTLAAYTGFREGELASLTPASFNLDDDPPTVTAEASYSKRRRKDVQPLRPDVAEMMRPYIADKPSDQLLWPGSWGLCYVIRFSR